MLIREIFENTKFPAGEKCIVDYLLENKAAVRHMTTKQIADAAYGSPSSLIRIAHKLGYEGWESLKNDYCDEEEYLTTHFQEIDPNFPFTSHDSSMSIASRIAALKKEAIDDTLSLLQHDDLSRAVRLLQKSSSLEIFGVSINAVIAQKFAMQMARLQYPVHVHQIQNELIFNAALCPSSACSLFISYSGETSILLDCMKLLKEKSIPSIVITSLGSNSLSINADAVLHISTREKLYSKIGNYVSDDQF